MNYLEKLIDAIEYIGNRHHKKIPDINIKFVAHKFRGDDSDYEYVAFSAEYMTIELRLDLLSLANDLYLPEPTWFNAFPSIGIDKLGFMFVISDEWNKKYENKEYIEQDYIKSLWNCDNEFFDKRYERFNKIIEKIKSQN